ncbi:MAG: LacI family transcriptional regulator [Chloroflexi bacterium]|jgi:LacI family transcriptional regulator|nr:LacI family transcriptional regulator [Chloroflexota bacterium]
MTVTIKDVAAYAQCSIKTVSRVVNDESYVAEATRLRVQDAINALGYVPNISARRLVQSKSYVICILLHEAGFYQSAVLSKVMDIGYQFDYDILIQSYFPVHSRSKNKLSGLIRERRVDGLVITPPCDVDPFLNELLITSRVPYVQITPLNRTGNIPYVTGDDYQGAYLMTERLILMGHWRIAFLSGPRNHRTSIDRLYGYKAALEMYRVPFDADLVWDSLFNFDGGYNATKLGMAMDNPPTAIFGGSDEAAIGALYALQEMKIPVPQKISVCGFGNLPQSQQTWPGLSTVDHPVEIIVERAVEILLDILANREPASRQIVLPCQLVMRGSAGTKPPN